MTRVGLAFHPALAPWLDRASSGVECVELVAERFYEGSGGRHARELGARFPLVVRTRRLSLASPEEADAGELASLASFVAETGAPWVSDHLGFRYAPGIDLGGSCPALLDRTSFDVVVERALRAMEALRASLLIRNLASPLVVRGSMSEPEFVDRLCEATGCGISLDATALLVNARNHDFDPRRWLDAIDRSRVAQVHAGGCREIDGLWDDTHDAPIDDDLCELLADVLGPGTVDTVILDWEARFPPAPVLDAELRRLKALADIHGHADAGR